MTLSIKRVSDPTPCYALRFAVFVEEQNVPLELERDALDDSARSLGADIRELRQSQLALSAQLEALR